MGDVVVQAVYLKSGSTTVYIESAKVEENISNPLRKIVRPVTTGRQDPSSPNYKPPGTEGIDLKRLEHLFIVSGFISASDGSGNESYGTAVAAKNALIRYILFAKGSSELHYRTLTDSDYSTIYNDGDTTSSDHVKVIIDRVSITDASIRADAPIAGGGINRYAITLSLTRAKVRGE